MNEDLEDMLVTAFVTMTFVFVGALALFLLLGCNGTTYDEVPQTGGGGDSLTYDRIHAAVIAPKCLACHGPGPKDLSTYAALMKYVVPGDSQGSKLCTLVAIGKMPPGNPLPQESVDLLCEWISDGAPEV
jgi:hypothetical protein